MTTENDARQSSIDAVDGTASQTSTAADRTVFQDRDGRELTLFRVADGAALPFIGYTESTIAWGNSPTRTATHAGHVSIDVSAGVPCANYYPREETTVEGTPLAVSLTARVQNPEAAGYPDAAFVVRLVADDPVITTHGSALPTAFDLVYWSLADDVRADIETVATDGGSAVAPNLDAAVDYDALDADNDLEYLVRLAREALDVREADTDTAAALWVLVEWLDEHRTRFYSDPNGGEAVATDGGQDQDAKIVPADEQATDADVREAVEAAERDDTTSPGPDGEWDPEPVSLREGETPDLDSHARRNLEQIEQGLEDDIIGPDDLSAEQREQLDLGDEVETDDREDAEPRLMTDGGQPADHEVVTGLDALDRDALDMESDLEYLVGLAHEAAGAFGDDSEAAKWAVAQWMQEIGFAPDLSAYDAGEMVSKSKKLAHEPAVFGNEMPPNAGTAAERYRRLQHYIAKSPRAAETMGLLDALIENHTAFDVDALRRREAVPDGGSKYVVPTGDMFETVLRISDQSAQINPGTLKTVEWSVGTFVYFVADPDGVQATATQPPEERRLGKPARVYSPRGNGSGRLTIPDRAIDYLGVPDGKDVRVYAHDEDGLLLVAKADDPRVMTDGGQNRCVECGAFIPDEIVDGTGTYCPQCGTGQMISDGGREHDVVPICALENPDTDDEQVVAHGMSRERVDAWELGRFVVDRESSHWHDGLDGLSLGESVPLDAEYEEVAGPGLATDGAGLLAEPEPQADEAVDGNGMATLGTYDEVYDRDRGRHGEVREVVYDAVVSGGRTVDRLRIRWDGGEDEWFHRSWLCADAGREIVRVERDGGAVTGDETEVNVDVNE